MDTYGNKKKNSLAKSGFTLIELLVVVAIIGLLSSIVMVALIQARVSARMAKVNADLTQLVKVIEIARDAKNNALYLVTGNSYSMGTCVTENTGGTNLRNLPPTDPCITTMATSWSKLGLATVPMDPWGSPYMIDENEVVDGACPLHDDLRSAGPDGTVRNADDIHVDVPHYVCPGV